MIVLVLTDDEAKLITDRLLAMSEDTTATNEQLTTAIAVLDKITDQMRQYLQHLKDNS